MVDNALVIHDYNGFNIWVMGQRVATGVPATDGKWHHMALTWQNSNGIWKVYKDGSNVKQNTEAEAFQKGQVRLIKLKKSNNLVFPKNELKPLISFLQQSGQTPKTGTPSKLATAFVYTIGHSSWRFVCTWARARRSWSRLQRK